MKKNSLILKVAFVAMVALQISVILGMIGRYEHILWTGKAFKFKTAPVDPYDAFRGRYVELSLKQNEIDCQGDFTRGEKVFLKISTDKDGFARLSDPSPDRPDDGADYLEVKVDYCYDGKLRFENPFGRFYLPEGDAPRIEEIYRKATREKNDTYVGVKIKNGCGVIENLYINGVPAAKVLQQP